MYQPKDRIRYEDEVEDVATFLNSRWEATEGRALTLLDWGALVQLISGHARRDARDWFDQYQLTSAITAQLKLREHTIAQVLGIDQVNDRSHLVLATTSDGVSRLLQYMAFIPSKLREAVMKPDGRRWDFERHAQACLREMADFVFLQTVRPKGWEEFRKQYQEHDQSHLDYYDKQAVIDKNDFKGAELEGNRSPSFPERVSLPDVAYGDIGQGRSPAYSLISAIYGHFLGVTEHNNTRKAIDAVNVMVLDSIGLVDGRPILAESLPQWQTTNAIASVVLTLGEADCARYTDALQNTAPLEKLGMGAYEELLKKKREEDGLSAPDVAALAAQREAIASRIISEILSEESSGDRAAKEAEEQASMRSMLDEATVSYIRGDYVRTERPKP